MPFFKSVVIVRIDGVIPLVGKVIQCVQMQQVVAFLIVSPFDKGVLIGRIVWNVDVRAVNRQEPAAAE